MSSGIFNNSNIPVVEQVLQFAQSRHEILAGNVANMDTPGYRVRDLSLDTFQEKLREALDSRNQTNEPYSYGLERTSPGDPMREVRDSIKSILYHDQSDVGLEQQVTEMAKNQFMHNLAISVMTSQFRLLKSAIRERMSP